MKKALVGKRCISLLLVCCVVFSMLPVTVLAAELENVLSSREGLCEHHTAHDATCGYEEGVAGCCTYACESCNRTILYSAESLAFSPAGGTYTEGCDTQTITLTRGNAEKAQRVTVLVYDNNANYGVDYRLLYNGEPIEKREGATSVYDAFREQGELTSGMAFDLGVLAAQEEAEESGEEQQPVSAADMLAQLDELGVCAASIPVTFAAGERTAALTLEILDDSEREYPETFLMAVLDEQGDAVESAQQLFTINDDEAAPTVTVTFDCESTLELDTESGAAQLTFRRTGDSDGALATQTLSALYCNGEFVGYIDFAPWQEVQMTSVMKAGVYTLDSADISTLDAQSSSDSSQQVTVEDNRPTTTTVPDGADPVLDAVPDRYAAMPTMRSGVGTRWLPDWAQGGSYSNENEIVVMGSTSNNLFKRGGNTSKGSASFNVDGNNIHDLNTSGTGSRMSKGYLFIDSNATYDLTGVESVEGIAYAKGVDEKADLCIGVNNVGRDEKTINDGGQSYEMCYTLPDGYQGSRYIYYGNTDPNKSSGGVHMYVPNGFKLNLRQYRFYIDSSLSTPLTYTGGTKPGSYTPNIPTTKQSQVMTINSRDYGANKTVDIAYTVDSQYPARLVGYRLRAKDGAMSELISLSGSTSSAGGSASFTFDASYLKKYEKKYCYEATFGSETTGVWTFHVVPVFEKIPIDSLEIREGKGGTITRVGEGTLYLGDYVEFTDITNNANLNGVWFEAKGSVGDDALKSGTSRTRKDNAKNVFGIDLEYSRYVVKGSYSKDPAKLQVNYKDDAAKQHGTLRKTGDIVSSEHYIAGTYETLIASANPGYVTKWENDGTVYYGNVLYYQLDGDADHNTFLVDFVQEETVTGTLHGTIRRAEVSLRLGESSYVPMKNVKLTINTGEKYEVTTDEYGNFTIENFVGVQEALYTAAVTYDNGSGTGYARFTWDGGDSSCNFQMSQFAAGVCYPNSVTADVNGSGSGSNMLELTESGTLNASVRVFVPSGYTIDAVHAYFLTDEQISVGSVAVLTAYDLTRDSTLSSGNFDIWKLTIPNAGGSLTSGTKLYVSVDGTTVRNNNGTDVSITVSSGLVSGGYQLTTPNLDTSLHVSYDIPETPGIRSLSEINTKLKLPVIGTLDFSLSSATGGFFTQRTNPEDGSLSLICGSSYLAYFGKGTVTEKYAQKQATDAALAKKQDAAANADTPEGGADAAVGASEKPNWFFSPAYLFKYTLSPSSDGQGVYLSGYEMALGVDAFYARTFPFTFYGVPLYVSLTFISEAYFDLQVAFADYNDIDLGNNLSEILLNAFSVGGDNSVIKSVNSFIAAPSMQFGAKAGVGYNTFLSVFLEAVVKAPFIIQLNKDDELDAGVKLSYTISAGADLVIFSDKISYTLPELEIYSDKALLDGLTSIQGQANKTQRTALRTASEESVSIPSAEDLLDDLTTFSVMERPAALRTASAGSSDTIESNAFKNTGVQLHRLGDSNRIMAFFLKDNEEDTLNYLSAAYAISEDCGTNWGNVQLVSDNTDNENSSLQYDINIFELGDMVLVTWSEANFDELLKVDKNISLNELTPAQVAKFMNAMDLRGQFFNSTSGDKIGNAFTIAENSTVACGALDAVRNGDNVYVYYQRNVFPESFADSTETVTLADLISTERAIALAHANVKNVATEEPTWHSDPVCAKGENGQQYRITDVEPFVHDGVMGEILVIDRDGLLVDKDGNPSNEDRQLYLRTYTFDEDGEPVPSARMAITDPDVCAQNPEVVSNRDYLHLFWNQDGEIVYITDFVATSSDKQNVQDEAYVVKNADGSVTAKHTDDPDFTYTANAIAGDESLNTGTVFTASMDESGNVLLAWISTDTSEKTLDEDPLPTDEIYGVVLETVTNDVAVKKVDSSASGNSTVYQLYAKGSPVALTDENGLLGALDSLCLGSNSHFLLAYSKLNDVMQQQATAAAVKTVHSENKAKLEITSVSAPSYPAPGSSMTVTVTVKNNGLGTANNVSVTASGVGSPVSETITELLPGRETTVELTVHVPENFRTSTTLNVTATSNDSTANASADILYGAYFLADDTLDKTRVGSSNDCWVQAQVRNMGNASGIPTLTFTNDLFAVNSDNIDDVRKTYTCVGQDVIAAGGTAGLTFLLEDTYLYSNDSTLTVSTEAKTVSEPTEPDEPVKPSKPSYTPTVKPSKPKKDETTTATFSDVAKGSYYADAVSWAVENGITTGTSKTTFSPDDSCTRAQIVTFLWRAAGSPAPKSSNNPFSDVRRTDYFYDAVLWAVELGITTGIRPSAFGPEETCTRAQAVTFLYRYEQSKGGGFTGTYAMKLPFTDVPQWCYESVAWCYMNEITNGVTKTTFGSDLECTRAQIVTLLYRSMA